jgi:two-component system, cell cycle response regulator CpdR
MVTLRHAARLVAAVASVPAMSSTCPVLVVDDDADVRAVVASILAEAGVIVVSVGSACEALAMLRASCMALLLTDVVMPGMNGIELAEAACTMQPRLRVIFMTGYLFS